MIDKIEVWIRRIMGMSPPLIKENKIVGKITSAIPCDFPKFNVVMLTSDNPIEEYDEFVKDLKGTTKINTALWGVQELDPNKDKCNGKLVDKETMINILWGDNWTIESDNYFLCGRRHIVGSVINSSALDRLIIEE